MDKKEFNKYQKQWRRENIEHCREYAKKWRESNPDKLAEYGKTKNMKPARKKYMSERYKRIVVKERSAQQSRNQDLKKRIISAYGEYCECCGETEIRFLTLDHIKGDGKEHRKKAKSNVYYDLARRGFPQEGYRILCMNCNWAIRYGTPCPHKIALAKVSPLLEVIA